MAVWLGQSVPRRDHIREKKRRGRGVGEREREKARETVRERTRARGRTWARVGKAGGVAM
jgi:hypothetical protein